MMEQAVNDEFFCPPGVGDSFPEHIEVPETQVLVPDGSVQFAIARWAIPQARNTIFSGLTVNLEGSALLQGPNQAFVNCARDDAGALILVSAAGGFAALTNYTLVAIDADTVELRADNATGADVETRLHIIMNRLQLLSTVL